MNKITILIVDDHKLIRDSWTFILNKDPRFRVIAETSSGDEAIIMAEKLKPDIILMDVNMTPVNGFETTKMIRKVSPVSKIIGVTMHSMPAYAKRMLQVGAMGYVTKNSSKDEMITAIMEVYNGKKYVCEEVKNILAHQELEEETNGEADMNMLTQRELEIVKHIRDGLSSKEIAVNLAISVKTVETHRYNIHKKLGLKNTISLINFASRNGL